MAWVAESGGLEAWAAWTMEVGRQSPGGMDRMGSGNLWAQTRTVGWWAAVQLEAANRRGLDFSLKALSDPSKGHRQPEKKCVA